LRLVARANSKLFGLRLAAIDAVCLAYMRSDSELAHREIKGALRAAFEAGSEKTKLAATPIRNHCSGSRRPRAGADREFRAALRLSKVAPRWRSSVIDGLWPVDLARGDNLRRASSPRRNSLEVRPMPFHISRCGHE
jgi:hypothetical protein